jgi:hypothetical protein
MVTSKPRLSCPGLFLGLPEAGDRCSIGIVITASWGFKMDQCQPTTPEVLAFAPNQKPRDGSDQIDQAGHALVAMLQGAANISNENVERAMTLAHKLSLQLRAAEDRIAQLEGEVERLQSRASRAEQWLEAIKNEIPDKLIAPMEANRPELPVVH